MNLNTNAEKQQPSLLADIRSVETTIFLEAHNGLSARIVEEAGFRGIWASGLTISSSLGVRDANEASWTQIAEVVNQMVDATKLPILVDGDSGYGDFNTARRVSRKLQKIGAKGICLEDKQFPKMNSFIGSRQPLADVDVFSGILKAVKDALVDEEFVLVARTEALVAERSLNEALDRAYAYEEAGADAILVHSKQKVADEVVAFAQAWRGTCPLVIVPTTYKVTPKLLEDNGFSAVIWANHLLRASITAMQQASAQIRDGGPEMLEGTIVPVSEIFRMLNYVELERDQQVYSGVSRER
ncbi:phosphoenolpyruvate mutase (plasmid) [Agrobacterium sp. rho-8.1]|nr:phosphoenolpyruvate mutase [Agrobacterium sp. rho-8.1]